jgi:hypothetical protein
LLRRREMRVPRIRQDQQTSGISQAIRYDSQAIRYDLYGPLARGARIGL